MQGACNRAFPVRRAYHGRSSDNVQATSGGVQAYLCLGASAAVGVNPDVLGLDLTTLVERHVLHELSTGQVSIGVSHPAQGPLWKINALKIKRTFSVLETTVESAACGGEIR